MSWVKHRKQKYVVDHAPPSQFNWMSASNNWEESAAFVVTSAKVKTF